MAQFGFGSLPLSEEDFITPEFEVQLGVEPVRIDLITDLKAMAFGDCWNRRKQVEISGICIQMIGLEYLIANKERAGRLRDLADAEELRRHLPN